MEEDVEKEQQINQINRLPAVKYYGLLLLIAAAVGLLIAALFTVIAR